MVRTRDERVPARFPPTRHSALAALRGADEEQRRRALSALTGAYWRPVYAYLRLHWRKAHAEAADLTQDFFAHLLEKELLTQFDPARARLRTFVRTCVDRIVAEAARDSRRLKRGGGAIAVPLDFDGERLSVERAAGAAEPPDLLFEREWARGVFATALRTLRDRCVREGKPQHFELLERYDLAAGPERPSYADLARCFGIATTDVTNRLAWARRQLREVVLDLLRECTTSDSELREEARVLLGLASP